MLACVFQKLCTLFIIIMFKSSPLPPLQDAPKIHSNMTTWELAMAMFSLAWPSSLTFFIQYAIQVASCRMIFLFFFK